MIRLVIADDHAILREGLANLLDAEPDIEIVATASNGIEAVERCVEERPDIALLDLTMPKGDGMTALRTLAVECPATRVVVLTMHQDEERMRLCLAAGAAAYIVKRVAAKEIANTVRGVHNGESDLARSIAEGARSHAAAPERHVPPPPSSLSPREREVLERLAFGHTSKEIAQMLGVSPKSVDSYRERIYDKLKMSGRAELVRYALTHGLLRPDTL